MNRETLNKARQVISLFTCTLLLVIVAIQRDGKVLGREVSLSQATDSTERKVQEQKVQAIRIGEDGSIIISTRDIAKDVIGYAGNIPLEIYIKEGRVKRVVVLEHAETPSFFESVEDAGLLSAWDGQTVDEALAKKVDAVSGATYTSEAIVLSVSRGLAYFYSANHANKSTERMVQLDVKFVVVLLVLLSAIILPFFFKSGKYRMLQQVLNVVVLGFWSGTFLSYSVIVNYVANGFALRTALIPLLLLVAFVIPLFGRKSHYCLHVCPMGGLQELAGKTIRYKVSLSARFVQILSRLRDALWVLLMLFMCCGLLFEWMDYEAFSVFLFAQASPLVFIIATVFVALAFVIKQPYCRFVCPTGALLRMCQKSKYKL